MRLSDLKPDKRNARKHGDRNLTMIADSLREVGAARSIVIDEDGRILAGNGTVEAAKGAGIKGVRVVDATGDELVAVRRSGLTEEQKRRLALWDNRAAETAEWDAGVLAALAADDPQVLAGMFEPAEVDALLAGLTPEVQPGAGGDEFDATPDEGPTTCQPGQLWALGRHRLLCGDSTVAADVARLMGGAKAEMVWTDPPYGVAIGDKNKFLNSIARSNRVEENLENDTLGPEGLRAMLDAAFANAAEHCNAGAGWYVAAPAGPLHLVFGDVLNAMGVWRQTIQWVKNNATFSPMGVDYHWQAEPIFYGWLPNAGHRYHGGRKQTTVWAIDRPTASPDHPTMKPVELVQRAVVNSSVAGSAVYDPFLGSGTTLIAAERTGRTCYGIEIAPRYCDVILRRYTAETGETPTLIEP